MDAPKYQRLRWKIISTTLAFSLVPLLGLGLFIYHQFSSTYTDKVTSNLKMAVDNKKKSIDLFLEEKIAQLKVIAYTHNFEELKDEHYANQLFMLIQSTSRSFIDVGVIDQNGNHTMYIGPYQIKNANYRDEKWFHEVMLKGLYISDVFMGFRHFPHFIIAVMRREGDKTWVLRATIDLDVFNSLVQSVQAGKMGDAYLINKSNMLQTSSRFNGPPMTEVRLPSFDPFAGTKIEKGLVNDQPRLLGLAWLDKINWLLVISEDPNEELSPLIRTHSLSLAFILGGVIIILAGAILTTQSIVKMIIAADRETATLDASLMQSSKMAALGKLAAGVAHEVNNPLTLIRENAGWIKDLLTEESPDTIKNFDEISEAVNKIDQHVERAKNVTHRMLGFGRRMEPEQENVNLNLLVDQTLKFLENEALHRSISVEKQYSQTLPQTATDIAQLQQVLLNVLDNAIDAIDKDGTIFVRTDLSPDGKDILVSIRDTGAGIAKDKMDKIFDPFFTTKKVGEGTGLGLAIVYGIIQKLGGRIEVHSEEGLGSTFTISLPVK